jgi:hypothetical protein
MGCKLDLILKNPAWKQHCSLVDAIFSPLEIHTYIRNIQITYLDGDLSIYKYTIRTTRILCKYKVIWWSFHLKKRAHE